MAIPRRERVPERELAWPNASHAFFLLCVGVAALTLAGEPLATPAGHVRLAATLAWLLATLAFSWGRARPAALAAAWVVAVFMARTAPAQDGFLMLTLGMVGAMMPPGRFLAPAGAAVAATLAVLWYPTWSVTLTEGGTLAVNFLWPMALGYAYHMTQVSRRAQQEAIVQLEAANRELARHAREADDLALLRARTEMARDLHDTLGHSLSAVTIELEAVRRLLSRAPDEAAEAAADAQSVAREAMADLRDFVGGLRQGPWASPALRRELERLATDAARRHGWRLDLAVAEALPPDAALGLLPVVREALTNIERHARAAHVTVAVRVGAPGVTVVVQDDGQGFDAQGNPSRGHWGLVNMRERVAAVGGTLSIESRPGHGTTLVATVPARGGGP